MSAIRPQRLYNILLLWLLLLGLCLPASQLPMLLSGFWVTDQAPVYTWLCTTTGIQRVLSSPQAEQPYKRPPANDHSSMEHCPWCRLSDYTPLLVTSPLLVPIACFSQLLQPFPRYTPPLPSPTYSPALARAPPLFA